MTGGLLLRAALKLVPSLKTTGMLVVTSRPALSSNEM